MLKECQLVSIFCEIDDFCKELDKNMPQPLLTSPTKSRRGPICCLSVSEIMTIQVLFQMVAYSDENAYTIEPLKLSAFKLLEKQR